MSSGKTKAILSKGWDGHRIPKACIVGLGLIGGSWAGALHQKGWEVYGVEQNQASLNQALNYNWIQKGWQELPDRLDVDLVVLALPLHSIINGLEDLVERLDRGGIITDVGSIKTEICHHGNELLERGVYFIGGHPMTGSEKSGFSASSPNLFDGYPYVLTPGTNCPIEVVEKLSGLISSFGANVVLRQPSEHDVEVALVSHIPHVLSVALTLASKDISEDGSVLQLAGRSFRELTRIADSSPEMWQEIMVKNGPAILDGLEKWQKRLNELCEYVKQKDGERIADAFRNAGSVRRSIKNSEQKDSQESAGQSLNPNWQSLH